MDVIHAGTEHDVVELRNFTEDDWEGFSGAESPSETQPPMYGEDFSGQMMVVADKNGVYVVIELPPDEEDGEYTSYQYGADMPFKQAKMVALLLVNMPVVMPSFIEQLGFRKLN